MIELDIYRGESTRLNDVPVIDGNLIITKDTGEMYADFDDQRVQIGGKLNKPESYEPKLTKVESDFTRYLYLGADKSRWMTAPEDVTLRATFQGGATIDYKTSGYELEVDYNGTNYAINFNGVTVWTGSDTSSIPVSGRVGLMHNGNSNLRNYTGAFVAESFQFYWMSYNTTVPCDVSSTNSWTLIPFESESSVDVVTRGLKYYRKPGTGRSILIADSPQMTSSKVKVKMAGPAYEAGVVFRYVDEKNYSYAFVNWDGNLVHIYQVIDGVEHAIASSIQIGDHQAHSDLTIVDASLDLEELHADAYTVTEDRKVYLVFNQKVKFDRLTLALAPAGILTEAGVAVNDYIISFDNSSYNLADILKNGYNGIAQTAIVWDNNVRGYQGETLSTDEVATVWGAEHRTYQFAYVGEVASVNSLPKLLTRCENVMMSVSDDMYLCMSNDYLIQTVLRNYKISTQPTCIIATESIASAVQSVTILCGNETIATLSQSDLKAMFLGTQGTPSFDWLTTPYETRLTIDGSVVSDLDFNGFDKEKNIISGYSAQACFISGVNGITGNSLANEYSIILNPQIMSVDNVELGIETWQKVPGGAINVDLEVRGDSFKPVANKAVRDYVNDKVNQVLAQISTDDDSNAFVVIITEDETNNYGYSASATPSEIYEAYLNGKVVYAQDEYGYKTYPLNGISESQAIFTYFAPDERIIYSFYVYNDSSAENCDSDWIDSGTTALNLLDGNNTNALYQESEKDDTNITLNFSALPKDNLTTNPARAYNRVAETGENALSLGTSVATGKRSVAIGSSNVAGREGYTGSHAALAAGKDNFAEGDASAAIGYANYAKGFYSTAFGQSSQALGEASHAEGFETIARSNYSHTEGCQTEASNTNAHAEGYDTTASGMASHAEGSGSQATAEGAHAEGFGSRATAEAAHAEGYGSLASFRGAHAEGGSVAKASYAHSEGLSTTAQQEAAHSEGYNTDANGYAAHAEGKETNATAEGAHSEGIATHAVNTAAHAEGNDTGAAGAASHAEGWQSYAMATCSHAEGIQTRAGGVNDDGTPNGMGEGAHAEGYNTVAEHHFSHAAGYHTRTSKNSQTVVGSYNADNSNAMFIVGRGTSEGNRLNSFESLDDGRAIIGADPINPMDVATKQYVDSANEQKLNSKITIYNNVRPSTFDWWGAINQALGNTEVDDSNMQTGCFQLNLADGCYFTGFDNDWVYDKNQLNSALVNFTVVYFAEGSHEMTLAIDWNGTTYKSNIFGSSWYPDKGFSFAGIPDNIPFTKATQSSVMIVEFTANNDGVISSNASFMTIYDHFQNGYTIYAKVIDQIIPLTYLNESYAEFQASNGLEVTTLVINTSDIVIADVHYIVDQSILETTLADYVRKDEQVIVSITPISSDTITALFS